MTLTALLSHIYITKDIEEREGEQIMVERWEVVLAN
jgi:hypothetical protein